LQIAKVRITYSQKLTALSFIKRLFKKSKKNRMRGDDLAEQAELAECLRDMLSVAWKYNFPVVTTIEVNGMEVGIICRGKDDRLIEALFNYAAGRALVLSVEAQEWANLNDLPAGRWKPRKG
jgi:hypothetical protein